MKVKIIKDISAELVLEDGQRIKSKYLPNKSSFVFDMSSPKRMEEDLKVVGLDANGNVMIRYSKDQPYEEIEYLTFEKSGPLEIEDYFIVYSPKSDKTEQKIRLIFDVQYQDIEIDENSLKLRIKETAKDSSANEFYNGDESFEINAKVGETFSSKLLKSDKNDIYKIVKVDRANITISINQDKEIIINQSMFYCTHQSGGFNTRYDYEYWERYFSIELIIDSIKFKIL